MKKSFFAYFILLLLYSQSCSNSTGSKEIEQPYATGENNIAYQWGKISLVCTANDTEKFRPRPTVTSRILALVWTGIFDAWSRYDEAATPLYLAHVARRPAIERSIRNKEIAVSYAAYRTLKNYYFSDSTLLRNTMLGFGLDPDDHSLDASTPVGIGNLAAKNILEARLNDGANEKGKMPSSDGTFYSDYTGYTPFNSADEIRDVNKWQPKYFSDGTGGKFAPACLTPHWYKVIPLALDSACQFRPGPPPAMGSKQLATEIKQVIDLQVNLTDEQKALVEFMRDGPKSVQQAGHWLIFAQHISVRDKHTLDDDVKMYFLVEAVAMDVFIAAWDAKMYYDFARPFALVRAYYHDVFIQGWAGPGKGMAQMNGNEWIPYSPETFVCPPFPAYVSGHSAVSGGCAEILKRFTGKDTFGHEVKMIAGALTDPDHTGDTVTLKFPTLSQTAEMAGFSRVLGGYHIQADNVEGLKLGRNVADVVWRKYLKHTGLDEKEIKMTKYQ